jgi:protein TonB
MAFLGVNDAPIGTIMMPLKDTLEASHAVVESNAAAAAESVSKPDPGGLRSDAVSLDVPVKVHGSRVTEVVRGITPHTEPFEEQTSTMIVFPQGGVLRMSTPVTAGQMMVVTNLKSGHDAICRVVKVRAYAQAQSYVEIEFTNRQQGYWGVRFAGDNVESAKTFAPIPPAPIPGISTTVRFESRPSAEISAIPAPPAPAAIAPPAEVKRPEPPPVFVAPAKSAAPPAERPAQPNPKESSFVGIGAQEEVQPAATTTTFKTKTERTVAPAASLSMTELRGDGSTLAPFSASMGSGVPGEMTDLSDELLEETVALKPVQAEPVPAATVFTPMPIANAAPQKVFGARFDSLAPAAAEQSTEAPSSKGTNWFFIATGIAAMLVVAVGGGLYFHLMPAAKPNARAESTAPAVNLPAVNPSASAAASATPAVSNVAPGTSAQYSQQPIASPAAPVSAPANSVRVIEPASASASRAQVSAPVSPKPAKAIPDLSAALTEHPVSAQRESSDDADPAPAIDASSSNSGELQQMSSAANVAPPPPPVTRIKVGGDVHPPLLISSAMPVYPATARSSGITGNVVVQASISPTGAVVGTKVVSGPALLRQAAVDALRRWKYRPATLNGTPVSVDVTVTMAFHN